LAIANEPTLTPAQQAAQAQQRADELSTARKCYLRATSGARTGGGSDLVGRALRALKLINGGDFVDMDELQSALNSVDAGKLNEWANAYIAGLVQNKGNSRRVSAFCAFIAADGFRNLSNALAAFAKHRAWHFPETVVNPKSGKAFKFHVDVQRELNDMFALRLTMSRRAKWGTMA